MINHVVLISWKSGTDASTIAAAMSDLRALGERIPGVELVAAGEALAEGPYTHGLLVRLADAEALQAYLKHPAHEEVVKSWIGPHRDQILAVDFEG